MAKKNSSSSAPRKSAAPAPRAKAAPATRQTRNTAIPRVSATAARPEITQEQIARRAYEISKSSLCGSCDDNWFRAERELRGM